jgi:hypothetical protein
MSHSILLVPIFAYKIQIHLLLIMLIKFSNDDTYRVNIARGDKYI